MWFVPVAGGEFFLWPASEPGLWDACYAPDPERGQAQKWERLHEGCSLELAMSWAQVEAEEMDSSIASRDASWRKRKVPASEAQLGFLRGLGYRGETEGLSKNDASNLISIGKASRKFDRHYQKAINS
jgi:hypothetical protein